MRQAIRSTYGTVTDSFDDGRLPTCVVGAERTWCGDEDDKPLQVVILRLRHGTRDATDDFTGMLQIYADDLAARLRMSTGIQCRVFYLSPTST